jgi:hypothetical protein
MEDPDVVQVFPQVSPVTTGLSGDPLLKRLVSLAHLGWAPRLVLLSNGTLVSGTLISPTSFREALAESVRRGPSGEGQFEVLNAMLAKAVTEEDPDPYPLGPPTDVPEPRFIHLAEVTVVGGGRVPFMRLRLPAVSGFWLSALDEQPESEPLSEGG